MAVSLPGGRSTSQHAGHVASEQTYQRYRRVARYPLFLAGVMFVVGVVQVGMARIAAGGNASLAVSQAQQLTSMLLRGLGVAGDEAGRIAAQASDSLVRAGWTA